MFATCCFNITKQHICLCSYGRLYIKILTNVLCDPVTWHKNFFFFLQSDCDGSLANSTAARLSLHWLWNAKSKTNKHTNILIRPRNATNIWFIIIWFTIITSLSQNVNRPCTLVHKQTDTALFPGSCGKFGHHKKKLIHESSCRTHQLVNDC